MERVMLVLIGFVVGLVAGLGIGLYNTARMVDRICGERRGW